MASLLPIETVFIEFLRNLSETVQASEPVILVLRGSLLLRHWFEEHARPAADIDLECFERVRGGRGGRFTSLVDHGRGLCCFAAEPWPARDIEFDETDAPAGGQSLWSYGTPGERFYAGWVWNRRGGLSGQLQIDIAEAGSYDLRDIGVADVTLTTIDGHAFRFPAYPPEMMLAAKVSWLMRSLTRRTGAQHPDTTVWKGEPKDLFDVHLLLTRGKLSADAFRKALLAVGAEDRLAWNNLEALFDVRRGRMTDTDFANWSEFRQRHSALVSCGPVELLKGICDRLEPLLGDFYLREEMPFLLAINAGPADESAHLIYADWLEERGEIRGRFLRLFTRYYFRKEELSRAEWVRTRSELRDALRATSLPWLHQLFGTSSRFREVRQRIEDSSAP
jgi:uncharacterized protein (TIGR02996 family)